MPNPAQAPNPAEIYQIKVSLRGSRPPIWRRIQVRGGTTLAKLHRILQCVMGWGDAHLHQFVVQGERYGPPAENGPRDTKDERKYKLNDLVTGQGDKLEYNYDFGDYWQHALLVEKTLPPDENARYPVCLAGARACPPEDVGGTPGYEEFLEATSDSKHPQHKECLEWIGGEFDPEAFSVDEVNRQLRGVR